MTASGKTTKSVPPQPSAARPARRKYESANTVAQAADSEPDDSPDHLDLFEQAPAGYVLLDDAGCIRRINRAGAALLGWDAAWLKGKPFSRWVVQNDKQLFQAHQKKLSARSHCSSPALRLKQRQGRTISVRLESTRGPDEAGERRGSRSIIVDLSSQERSARKLRQLEAQLDHVTRLHTAGELASSLAHELNQPLGTITLNCDAALRLLQNGGARDYEFAEALTQACESASFASDVVRRLRGFLRTGDALHEVRQLADIVEDVAMLIEAYARDDDIELRVYIESGLPPVRVDAVQITQVLLNLAHNGIDMMRATGTAPACLGIRARAAPPGQIQISVTDTGPGVARRTLARIFAPFFTTKDGGMGMGLAISRRIVETHGGRLWADCGSGGRFHFTLPAVVGESDGA